MERWEEEEGLGRGDQQFANVAVNQFSPTKAARSHLSCRCRCSSPDRGKMAVVREGQDQPVGSHCILTSEVEMSQAQFKKKMISLPPGFLLVVLLLL